MDARSTEAMFEAALALPPAKRAAYLDQACAGDPELRQRVQALLQADEKSGAFLCASRLVNCSIQ